MFCKNCGNEIKEKGKFCQNCGTPVIAYELEVIEEELNTADNVSEVRIFCRNCGTEIKTENEFCPECGISVTSVLMSSLVYTLTKVIEKYDKESMPVDIVKSQAEISHKSHADSLISSEPETINNSVENKEENLSINEIIMDFLERLLFIPICWLTSMLINAVVIPCFSDNWIFIKFLPYCLFCFLLATAVFGIPLSIINIIYYAVKSDNKNLIAHTKSLLLLIVTLIVSYTLLTNMKIFLGVGVILIIVGFVLDKRGLLDNNKEKV